MRFSSPPSFVSVEKPRFSAVKPLLVSSPHSGRCYPEPFLVSSCLSEASLRRTEDRLMDWFCDGLSEEGVTVIKTSLPRVWCDVNRGCAEVDERMFRPPPIGRSFERTDKVRAGFGVIPRLASHSIPIYTHCLPLEELDQRLSAGWFPYHAAVERELACLSHQYSRGVVLLDMHSMPPLPISAPCDIVLGDLHGRSCDFEIMAAVRGFFQKRGYAVRLNAPYAGGYITQHYGRPTKGQHALQVEINRSCYLNMNTYELSKNAELVKRDIRDMICFVADEIMK
ncbi:N-formylglutamate amidohydrolase [Neokomagataea anthophila]|uniref:N-formylglutamate amidohydrolase n=1 Tax=Neokomagataea anthophila TaxID=2826925 RepID=A0ABS5E6Z5_9PROT|nr:N-formylglutamate amidohydrolase [Neokomagataea anthophila]MBR0559672.1 N-formylglutamate amidohydrolase [Neokomagataea anthophila]